MVKKIKTFNYLIILSILLSLSFGILLRAYNLNFEDLWFDEMVSFWVSDPSITFKESYIRNNLVEGHPFLFNFSLKVIFKLFGYDPDMGRYFSCILGILSIFSVAYISKNLSKIQKIIKKFKLKKIRTSLFIDANLKDVKIAKELDADCIEFHTGKISDLIKGKKNYIKEYKKIKKCCEVAKNIGLEVHAGHGLDYKSTAILSKIKEIEEFNIGHFIIGESIVHGLKNTIKRFKKISNI